VSRPDLVRGRLLFPRLLLGLLAGALLPHALPAQGPKAEASPTVSTDTVQAVVPLSALNVTVTRGARQVFHTPAPVLVVERTALDHRGPGRITDVLALTPGMDVVGVGTVRQSPMIRGLQGQRILLLEDGVRLNNPRREVSRGEPLSLADVSAVQQVEVVRGPASVLYGSDAIGGVVNVVTTAPDGRPPLPLTGRLEAGAAPGDSWRAGAAAEGVVARFRVRLSLAVREDDEYLAPAGRFGDISLASPTPVHDSGARERRWSLALSRALGPGDLFLRHHTVRAEATGFGYVDPELLGEGLPRLRIHMPYQDFHRSTLGWRGAGLERWWADRVELVAYQQANDREFVTELFAPMAPPAPAGAAVAMETVNASRLSTYGLRAEARKLVARRALLTWGVDVAHDVSTDADTSTTVVSGFGPPRVTGSGTSPVPDASLTSAGLFAQGETSLLPRLDLTAGVRWRQSTARATDPAGRTEAHTDAARVGALSLLYRAGQRGSIVTSMARGFRSPNLVERFYSGPTKDGRGVWGRNPGLGPEHSLSLDLGFRHRSDRGHVEVFVFQNTLHDGIQVVPTDREIDGLREYRNENMERLRFRGAEGSSSVTLPRGISLGLAHTHITGRNLAEPHRPITDTYRNRTVARVRLDHRQDRAWVEYSVRHTRGQVHLEPGVSPVGDSAPAFTVHDLRAALRITHRQQLVAEVANLTDRLYAESANTRFFRPAPRRTLWFRWSLEL
jgi:outer membrane receptor protein involved in Fe transport